MWNEFFTDPFNLRNLYLGICIVMLIMCNNETGVQLFVNSLREKDKRLKDYLIITLGVLMVNLFLYSCGSDIGTLPEKDPDAPVSY